MRGWTTVTSCPLVNKWLASSMVEIIPPARLIIGKIKQRVRDDKYETSDELEFLIHDEIKNILLSPCDD